MHESKADEADVPSRVAVAATGPTEGGILRGWVARLGLGPAFARRLFATGRRLSKGEARLVETAADAFFPPGEVMPLSGSQAGLVGYVEDYLGLCRPVERLLLHLLLAYTDIGPLLFGPAPRPFTRLAEAERLEHLRAAYQSRLYLRRIAFTSLRALMTMGYLAHPVIARHVGIVHDTDPFGAGRAKEQAR